MWRLIFVCILCVATVNCARISVGEELMDTINSAVNGLRNTLAEVENEASGTKHYDETPSMLYLDDANSTHPSNSTNIADPNPIEEISDFIKDIIDGFQEIFANITKGFSNLFNPQQKKN